ncbi:hypothetical protein [Lysinibacillus pakistanensis]|uniref:hypothetical protein n=2 Tax=Lysinibacillus TaxID=400634 RepID=UPI0028A8F0AA|nr:hypothetical protein [Lysinibacillus pakistanensis]
MGSNMLMPKLALDLEAKKSSFVTKAGTAIIRNCLVGGHLAKGMNEMMRDRRTMNGRR